jgi:hypothetical protein
MRSETRRTRQRAARWSERGGGGSSTAHGRGGEFHLARSQEGQLYKRGEIAFHWTWDSGVKGELEGDVEARTSQNRASQADILEDLDRLT